MASHPRFRVLNLLIALVLLASAGAPAARSEAAANIHPEIILQSAPADGSVVARVYYDSEEEKKSLASRLDVWEVNREEGYLVVLLGPGELEALQAAGYRAEVDAEKTAMIAAPVPVIPGQTEGIPGYPCYRTVEETFTSLDQMVTDHPTLIEKVDIGDSWNKATPGGLDGYDLWVAKLTNQETPGPKPKFFAIAAIHAREYTTAEMATRFAEYLVNNYGTDPDVTWLLDYNEIHLLLQTNPDGRKLAEAGDSWRKNVDSDDGCTDPGSWGVDLNRNFDFKWGCCGGSSGYPCDDTYRGPLAGSEPEAYAVQDYLWTLFPDQRGPGDTDPAPPDATGIFIDLHSYSELVLWSWGWTTTNSPNFNELRTLGRKFTYYNHYDPDKSYTLYPTDGTTIDYAYGQLGVAAYTFEMGTNFFQGCSYFETNIVPGNLPALLFAAKASRSPYLLPAGPEPYEVATAPGSVEPGVNVQLTANVADNRYYDPNGGTEPTQNIAAAEYYIDIPPWITTTVPVAYPMAAADGAFDEKVEAVVATIDTSSLSAGRHIIFVRSRDALNNWGVVSAAFIDITIPDPPVAEFSSNSPVELGSPALFINETTGPGHITYQWDFGDGVGTSTETNPAYIYAAAGTYTVILTATNQGGSDTASHPVEVVVGCTELTSADLTFTPAVVNPGGVVEFTADLLPDNATLPFTYTLDFGDGTLLEPTAGMAEPLVFTHTYATTGQYPVEFGAWNCAMTEPVTDSVLVDVTEPCLPLEGISLTLAAPGPVYAGVPVDFLADLFPDGASKPYNYTIDFGDGITPVVGSSSADPLALAHTYGLTGTFTATITAWNCDEGAAVSASLVVTVVEAPPCVPLEGIALSTPGPVYAGFAADFSADLLPEDATTPFHYTIDFGDGLPPVTGTSTEDPIALTHTYLTTGTYTATITAWNCDEGAAVSTSLVITVLEPPACWALTSVDLTLVTTSTLYAGTEALFSADFLPEIATPPFNYSIDFGEGVTPVVGTTETDPLVFTHTFTSAGVYTLTLTAWNCDPEVPVVATLEVTVIEPLKPYLAYLPVIIKTPAIVPPRGLGR